eukprot:INCI5633.2.p1 GENE.INCI5633.2~~INCI5633.2.p1  ORF type:complete len:308 (+),score=40.70 INCI5633.2:139-1062(+)
MSETEGSEVGDEWWMALLPAGVRADVSYLRQGFVEYFFQKFVLEDYAHVLALAVVAVAASPVLSFFSRRAAPLLPMTPLEISTLLSLVLLAFSVVLHPSSVDAMHYYQTHEVVSWCMFSTALLHLFDVASEHLEALRVAKTRGLLLLSALSSIGFGLFGVLVCGDWKMDGGGWSLQTRAVPWQALGYAALALSAACFVLPLWLEIVDFAQQRPSKQLGPMVSVALLGTLMICCAVQVGDSRFGVAQWRFALSVIPEILATFVAIYGGLFLFIAPFRLAVTRLVSSFLPTAEGRKNVPEVATAAKKRK